MSTGFSTYASQGQGCDYQKAFEFLEQNERLQAGTYDFNGPVNLSARMSTNIICQAYSFQSLAFHLKRMIGGF
jgi:hypothetical protein